MYLHAPSTNIDVKLDTHLIFVGTKYVTLSRLSWFKGPKKPNQLNQFNHPK
jgi:hypothetical protein